MTGSGQPMRMTVLASIGAALSLFLAGPTAARADCVALQAEASTVAKSGPWQQFGALLDKIGNEPTCPQSYRAKLGRVLALTAIKQMRDTSVTPSLADLEAVARLGRPWQVLVPLGDAHYEAGDYAAAFKNYEAALDDMQDSTANPTPPDQAWERRTYNRALQARALSKEFVASRALPGEEGGVKRLQYRTFTVTSVPVPVQFAFDSDKLTAEGEKAANEILGFAMTKAGDGLVLIGHTDAKGGPGYNIALAERRAASVRDYLSQHGYKGRVEVVARGEAEPFIPDDPAKYSPDQLDAMSRRVEYRPAQ